MFIFTELSLPIKERGRTEPLCKVSFTALKRRSKISLKSFWVCLRDSHTKIFKWVLYNLKWYVNWPRGEGVMGKYLLLCKLSLCPEMAPKELRRDQMWGKVVSWLERKRRRSSQRGKSYAPDRPKYSNSLNPIILSQSYGKRLNSNQKQERT